MSPSFSTKISSILFYIRKYSIMAGVRRKLTGNTPKLPFKKETICTTI